MHTCKAKVIMLFVFSHTAAGSPSNVNVIPAGISSFRVSWTPPANVTGYQVYWSGNGGADSGNMSVGADDGAVTITGRTPGLTYNITIVALSDHLPSPVVGTVMKYALGELLIDRYMYHSDTTVEPL